MCLRRSILIVAVGLTLGLGAGLVVTRRGVSPTGERPWAIPVRHAAEPDGPASVRAARRQAPPSMREPHPSAAAYPWLDRCDPNQSIRVRIWPPAGFRRVPTQPGSFAHWLRHLPLKDGAPPVRLYDGRLRQNQSAHAAVIDLDVGARDLQQCADTIIRLRAEYLYQAGRSEEIRFHFTSGDLAEYSRWAQGYRPVVRGRRVTWARTGRPAETRASLRSYLTQVFVYAGTLSLARELQPVADGLDVRIGDVFLRGGSPGHAAIVVDLAEDPRPAAKVFLLAQGFLPAQDAHILRNPGDRALSPWYAADFAGDLHTPEYTFRREEQRRFGP